MVRRVVQSLMGVVIAFLVADVYANNGAGYGWPVEPYVYWAVGALALAVPVFWALTHVCMGLVMGMSGGGLWEGLRMGIMLGFGMALGKMWIYLIAAGVGVLVGQGPPMYAYGLMGAGVLCFGLDRALQFFWREGNHHDG